MMIMDIKLLYSGNVTLKKGQIIDISQLGFLAEHQKKRQLWKQK